MPAATSLALGGAALAGMAGAMKDNSESSKWIDAGSPSALEGAGQQTLSDMLAQLNGMVGAGPGQQDVTAGLNSQRDLAAMLDAYSKGNGADPTQNDIQRSNTLAGQLFASQRTAMSQNFADQTVEANRQAALMGRSMNDPILRAKLAQEQTRQSSLLDANQGAWATQYAMGQPMQRLGFTQERAGVLQGLASQALANRQALAAMGEGIMNTEREFRLQTARQYGQESSGGGLKGFLTGAMAGAGTGLSAANAFQGFQYRQDMLNGSAVAKAAPPQGNFMPRPTQYSAPIGPQLPGFSNYGPNPAPNTQFGPWSSGYGWGK